MKNLRFDSCVLGQDAEPQKLPHIIERKLLHTDALYEWVC